MKFEAIWKALRGTWFLLLPLLGVVGLGFRLSGAVEQQGMQIVQLGLSVREMQEKGHLEHELRIRAAETAILQLRADKGEKAVISELATSVRDMTNAMRLDHDVLVRLVTITEQRSKEKP